MKSIQLDLMFNGVKIAEARSSDTNTTTIEYVAGYVGTPVSLSMPTSVPSHSGVRVDNWLQGLLPDNDFALRSLRRAHKVAANKPLALLEKIGSDAPGAVKFVPAGSGGPTPGGLVSLTDNDVASLLKNERDRYGSGVNFEQPAHVSLAGAQPKLGLVLRADGSWALPTGGQPSTHILKPDPQGRFSRMDALEQLAMRAATHLGLSVAQSELMDIGGERVYVSARFDRGVFEGQPIRLHQEDILQALGIHPSKKYNNEGGPGINKIGEVLATLPHSEDTHTVGFNLFQGMLFNLLSRNSDAHSKNYSFVLDGERIKLAPLYDLMSTVTLNVPQKFPFYIGDETLYNNITLDGVMYMASLLHVPFDLARTEIQRQEAGLVTAFEKAREDVLRQDPHAREFIDAVVTNIAEFSHSQDSRHRLILSSEKHSRNNLIHETVIPRGGLTSSPATTPSVPSNFPTSPSGPTLSM